ncbi:hypothetical protein, partial [Acinetobacter sp.]
VNAEIYGELNNVWSLYIALQKYFAEPNAENLKSVFDNGDYKKRPQSAVFYLLIFYGDKGSCCFGSGIGADSSSLL